MFTGVATSSVNLIMDNKRYKYIIDLLVSTHETNEKKGDASIISSMRLADNKIRYRTR